MWHYLLINNYLNKLRGKIRLQSSGHVKNKQHISVKKGNFAHFQIMP